MLQDFKDYIEKGKLFSSNERILLAVSGGVDSIAMCHLFHKANFNFGIAHCNFQLRGNDSEEDAIFVKSLAQDFDVPFFQINFDTANFATENKLSIQVAARELRYEWLEKIRIENDFQYLATAHHLDDSLETVLYNFTKGCGIRGLHGILPKKNKLIRPLLFTHKEEVLKFIKKQNIAFREDLSNRSDKYARNHIRHHVIPLLQKINPSVQQTTEENIKRLRETELIFNYAIELLQKEVCEKKGELLLIHLEKLKHSPAPATLLYEILVPFGFNNTHTQQMMDSIDNQSGAIFYSKTHEVLLDRDYFILKKRTETIDNQLITINKVDLKNTIEGSYEIKFPQGKLSFGIKNTPYDFSKKEKHKATFDLEKLSFPLTLRRWQAGDYFQPLGMNGQSKKVKSLLTDLKLNRFEKEEIWVLESNGKICWVVGIRLDERFKISKETEEYVEVIFS